MIISAQKYVVRFLAALVVCVVPSVQANDGALIAEALSSFELAKYEDALQKLNQVDTRSPANPEVRYLVARSLYRAGLKGDWEKADELLEENIEEFPDHVPSHYLLGSVKLALVTQVSLFKKVGFAKDGLTAWKRTIELDPDHVEAQYGIAAYYLQAPSIAGGNKDKAKSRVQVIRGLHEGYGALINAQILASEDQFEQAESAFKRAEEGIPNRAFPTMIMASFYFKEGLFEKALAKIESYQRRSHTWNDPTSAHINLLTARIKAAQKDAQGAQKALQLLYASAPNINVENQARALEDDL